MKTGAAFMFLGLVLPQLGFSESSSLHNGMISIPDGKYMPFYLSKNAAGVKEAKPRPVAVGAFWMDRHPVTRAEYLGFVRTHRAWRKSHIKQLFADSQYLEDWKDDAIFTQEPNAPVTFVSWFAAAAYCEAQGKELPTTDQWEYAAADDSRNSAATSARIMDWYAEPNPKQLSVVESTPENGFGVFDLHGIVWEWTSDFNSVIGDGDDTAFCAGASQGARDATDYVSFMRYSFRSSLQANYSVGNLGFRCVATTVHRAGVRAGENGHLDGLSIFQLKATWTDETGKRIGLNSLRGRPTVLAMVYTSCQAACPIITADIQRIEKALPPSSRQATQFVLVSFDGQRDTPERLRSFAAAHGLDLKRWTLLSGSASSVRNLAAVLGVKYQRNAQGDFSHSNLITILDSEGVIRGQQVGLSQDPTEAIETITKSLSPATSDR